MQNRTLVAVIAAVPAIVASFFGVTRAEVNPIKIVPKPQLYDAATVAASPDFRFECGTYKGNENETRALDQLNRSIKQRRFAEQSSAAPPNSFIFDNVWVVEDDGTLAISGLNVFDTDFQTIRFEPNVNNSYTAFDTTFSFDATLGTNLGLPDDGNSLQSLQFSFEYYGVSWTQLYVNSNGLLAFGGIPNPSGFFDSNDFFGPLAKIAPYFVDLDPSCGTGGVFFKSEPTKATITWNGVREWSSGCTAPINTLQIVLYDDGSFDVTFNGINATLSANGLPINFGIHPGGDPGLDIISFSDDLPYTGQVSAGFYERYLNITNPQVNEVGLIQEFYNNFSDDYFQIAFFTNFTQTMSGFANELNISNDVQGIGIGIFDNSAVWGSAGALESRCNMNRFGVWPTDPTSRFFGGQNNFLTIMGQEAGHRWGAFICFDDPGQVTTDPGCGVNSSLLLGRSYAHWSYYADVDHSSLEGGNWEFVSGNTYTTPTMIDYFGDIDEYIMGLRRPEEVTNTFYVSSPTNDLISARSAGTPIQGATATGNAVGVTINQIIAAEGARVPTADDEDKDLRVAFIILSAQGSTPAQVNLVKIANFRKAWEDYFEKSVDGRMTMNTSITEALPVAVVEGLVRDSGNNPLPDITVKELGRGFDQFVGSGGRYMMRFQQDSLAAPDSICATFVFSSPGYQPDTLVCCMPFDTTITKNVTLFGTITGVDDDAPIPVANATLRHAIPNPFNPRTTLSYVLRKSGPIHLGVYDTKGRLVRTLYDGVETSGEHSRDWDGRSDAGTEVSSGIYFVRLSAQGTQAQTRKVVLLK